MEVSPILKYLIAVTDQLASLSFLTGLVLSFALRNEGGKSSRRTVWGGIFLGCLCGLSLFLIRMYDPKGMNLLLIRLNRWLVIVIAASALFAVFWELLFCFKRKLQGGSRFLIVLALSLLLGLSLAYLVPPVLRYTQEFVYFGESGISTNALLRALGFSSGLVLCLMLALSSKQVHSALGETGERFFLFFATVLFFLDYLVKSVASLQRLKIISLNDLVFEVMEWGDENAQFFLFALMSLGLLMLVWVVFTHLYPKGEFANRALLRKEKARLRNCRRWSWCFLFWAVSAVMTVTVLYYYDNKPPAEVEPEPYTLKNGIIEIELSKVQDGHLHKFSYVTPNNYDVRFLVVKKPSGTAYGVGLDACDICGVAGYFERGDEVICRRCDVVMNKNTIGFKGGCNPVVFPYEVKNSRICIDVKELERNERRFR